jgi:hypothetical protein
MKRMSLLAALAAVMLTAPAQAGEPLWQSGEDGGAVHTGARVGIGTDAPRFSLEVNGTAAKPGGGSWAVASDRRLKDIGADYEKGLAEIARLKPVHFRYRADNALALPGGQAYVGFSAQKVAEVFPEAVSEGADGYLYLDLHPVNTALVNAVRELKEQNEALHARVEQLEQERE